MREGEKRVIKSSSICVFFCFVLFGVSNAFAVDAFPGAEGSGRFATGGRGGAVYEVTNLNNSGAGSIVDAVSQPNRTVVFRVSGTIALGSVILKPKSNITIAGQTAPGDGICLKGRIQVKNNNTIIRYIRVRTDAGGANNSGDAIDIDSGNNIIIDHVTASYGRDETISCGPDSNHVTVQWCIISEALTFEAHSYGSLIRGHSGQEKTYHHNLYAHNQGRNPRPGNTIAIGSDPEGLHLDFRNNVTYNWEGSVSGNNYDGPGYVSRYNFVGNDFIMGPESTGGGGTYYVFRESSPDANGYFADNAKDDIVPIRFGQWVLVYFEGFTAEQIATYKHSALVPMEPVTTTSAAQAKKDVLSDAGTSYPKRDIIDTRIGYDVLNKTGHSIWDTNAQPEGGWPALNSRPALTDSDHDGMPDLWETSHGLNPNDASDRNGYTLDPNYTNLEVYLDWLVSSVRTDIIYDGIVDFYDFAEFARHWKTSAGSPLYNERYDFDPNNGMILMDDFFYIAQDWLTSGQEY